MISGHVLLAGTTESGKTTLAKILCRQYKAAGIGTIVMDPMNDPGWAADAQTRDPAEFMRIAKKSRRCALFIDESAIALDRYDSAYDWLSTMSRHWGHRAHFIMQRPTQSNPNIRGQCSSFFVFRIDEPAARELARNFTKPEILQAPQLPRFHFIAGDRFGAVQRCRVDPAAGTFALAK